MGKLIEDLDKYPGWVHASKTCLSCGVKWEECFHIWMPLEFHNQCPYCPERKAALSNVVKFRRKQDETL